MKDAITILLFFIFSHATVLAYDSYNVHPAINENASRQSVRLPQALKDLGFNSGIDSTVNGKKIYLWFKEGGTKEDDPINRANNHFHDPLKPWDKAGLNDAVLGMSSLLFVQDQWWLEPIGNWSWKKGRTLYFEALSETAAKVREQKLADAFRSLGQMMHLLADSSVPAHTRNDIHVFPLELFGVTLGKRQTYESWAQSRWRNLNYTAKTVDPAIFTKAVTSSYAPVSISALWDQDEYNGTNPEVTWTTTTAISGFGLAEYTNANYFSEDTIFADYPHPRKDYTTARLTEQYAKDGKLDKTWYIMGYQTERLAAYSYFWDNSGLIPETKWLYHLDDFVYEDYADNLIPRAVGYSAALLDYFFRGKMEISLPTAGIYATTNDAGVGFTQITLFAKNTTSNGDEMTGGTIELVVKYKLAQSDPFQSTQVGKSEFRYIVVPEANNITSIPRDSRVELTFDLSQTPLPVNATDVYLQLVYHGKLGSEDGAVAVGFKDISEPTPIDVFNNMDKICINNGTSTGWYDAGSQSAIQLVDKNGDHIAYGTDEWDVYPHDLTLYVKFYNSSIEPEYASPSSYDYLIENLPAGAPMRALYVLGDEKVDYSFYTVRTAVDANDYWGHVDFLSLYYGDTVKNQEGDFPVLYNFRNFKMWSGAGFIYINPSYPDDNAQCPLNGL